MRCSTMAMRCCSRRAAKALRRGLAPLSACRTCRANARRRWPHDLMEPFRPVRGLARGAMGGKKCGMVEDGTRRSDGVGAELVPPSEIRNPRFEVTKEFRGWVTAFPLDRVEYLGSNHVQSCIEGVVRGFRRAVLHGDLNITGRGSCPPPARQMRRAPSIFPRRRPAIADSPWITEKFKMGWLIVAFDLPVGTKGQRKPAHDFREWLRRRRLPDAAMECVRAGLRDLCAAADARRSRETEPPPEGSVRAIFVTRAQWERSFVIHGAPMTETPPEDLPGANSALVTPRKADELAGTA